MPVQNTIAENSTGFPAKEIAGITPLACAHSSSTEYPLQTVTPLASDQNMLS